MMFIPWTWIAMAALAVLLGGGGFIGGCSYEHDRGVAALLKATEKARETEADWQAKVTTLEVSHADETRRIAAQRDKLAASLRDRPERRMPASATASGDGAGATGAQLSGPDSRVLAGIAADADQLASDLRACQAWVKTVVGR